MKAVCFEKYGSSDVLGLRDFEVPKPLATQCLVKVRASSINPIDWKIRQGVARYFIKIKFPFISGFDLSGEIEAVGEKVTAFKKGDLVYGQTEIKSGGACAEYVAVSEMSLSLKPKNLSFSEAASLPIAALTALQAFRDKGHLKPRQQVLIIGASGGVGHFGVQIAKAMGAEVTAVCSGKNVAFVKALGVDKVIDYQKEDFRKDCTIYDVILDAVGLNSYPTCRSALKKDGIYVSTLPTISNFFYQTILPFYSSQKAFMIWEKIRKSDLEDLNRMVEQGRLKPTIEKEFTLKETASAHKLSEKGRVVGKLVIKA